MTDPKKDQWFEPVFKRSEPEVSRNANGDITMTMYTKMDEIALKMAAAEDKMVRAGLIALGWTPPGELQSAAQAVVEAAEFVEDADGDDGTALLARAVENYRKLKEQK